MKPLNSYIKNEDLFGDVKKSKTVIFNGIEDIYNIFNNIKIKCAKYLKIQTTDEKISEKYMIFISMLARHLLKIL